ncbi:MAG: hypothetical protein FJY92_01800, partial [Candidatus Hydrogenedentes bacterium]|nr:hypothetical protein [Candidatus Hydrogenedentota bacterium]
MKAFVVAPALCLLACGAGAQTALVETAAMTAAREAVRVFVQEVRLDTGVASPLATPLPGAAPAAPLFVDADGAVVTATAGSDRGPASRIV